MRLRHIIQTCAAAAALAVAGTAAAQETPGADHVGGPGTAPAGPDARPEWRDERSSAPHYGVDPAARDAWLSECRRRISVRDDGLGGAVIGGLVGGFAGNRIAGRGNRTVGTLAGAAVGAAAGAAIDRAEDRDRVRDECEVYLDSYYDYYAQAGRAYGYGGYGRAVYTGAGCCDAAPRREPECTETVEYVYEDVPVQSRVRRIPARRTKVVPDKRI